jgi:hypothetical protein
MLDNFLFYFGGKYTALSFVIRYSRGEWHSPDSYGANGIRPYKPQNQIVPHKIEKCCNIYK